jgi:DNA-binding NarL/FixJ family response regulator
VAEKRYKILIVDDHQMIIDGLKALLAMEHMFEVVAFTTQPTAVLSLMAETTPDLVISDIEMPGLSGIDLCRQLKQSFPAVPVLALSMYGDKTHIAKALEAGVSGYILKNTGQEELVSALKKLVTGGMFFSDDVSTEMLRTFAQPKEEAQPEPEFQLTARETEIVKLIGQELSNAEIGEKLFISERTVETHRKNIFRKTNTKSVAGLMKYAFEKKIL